LDKEMSAEKLQFDVHVAFAARAQVERGRRDQRRQNAQSSLQLLHACFSQASPGNSHELPPSLQALSQELQNQSSLAAAFSSLNAGDREQIIQQVGERNLQQILSISGNLNTEFFWEEALAFGVRLKSNGQGEAAAGVLGVLTEGPGVPQALKDRAVLERNAVIGAGNWLMRTEFMLGQTFEKLDWKTAGLMAGGAAIGSLFRAGTLGRLLGVRGGGALTRGLAARAQAAFVGALVEGPAFAVASHVLMGGPELDGAGWAKLMAGGVLSLSLMRAVGFGGVSAVNGLGRIAGLSRVASLSRAVVGPGSGFLGLWGAHHLEVKLRLREGVADETTVINTLFAQATMGLLGQVGRAALGSGFAKFQADLERRAGLVSESLSRHSDAGAGFVFTRAAFEGAAQGSPASLAVSKRQSRSLVSRGDPVRAGLWKVEGGGERDILEARGPGISADDLSGFEGSRADTYNELTPTPPPAEVHVEAPPISVPERVTRPYYNLQIEVPVQPGLEAIHRLSAEQAPYIEELRAVLGPRLNQPWLIGGISDGLGLSFTTALIEAGAKHLVGVYLESKGFLAKNSPPHLGRLANVEGLRIFAQQRGVHFAPFFADLLQGVDGEIQKALYAIRGFQDDRLIFINSMAGPNWVSPGPGGEPLKDVPSIDLEGNVVLMNMHPYHPKRYDDTVYNLGKSHGVILRSLQKEFGRNSVSLYLTWRRGSQNWGEEPHLRSGPAGVDESGAYSDKSPGHAKAAGEAEALRYHLMSAEQSFAFGYHKVIGAPSVPTVSLFGTPGGGIFGLTARHVLEAHGRYLSIAQIPPLALIRAFGGEHNLANPAAQIELDNAETFYFSEIAQKIRAFNRRARFYRAAHPDWDGKPPPFHVSRKILLGVSLAELPKFYGTNFYGSGDYVELTRPLLGEDYLDKLPPITRVT
jgi:hypothetical protein